MLSPVTSLTAGAVTETVPILNGQLSYVLKPQSNL